jgi:hypothetical protein
LTTIVAYSAYLIAEHLQISGYCHGNGRLNGRQLRSGDRREDEYGKWRVHVLAINAARQELETMASSNLLSESVYQKLQEELEAKSKAAHDRIQELTSQRPETADEELLMARTRLLTAEKSSIRQSANNGLVSNATADKTHECRRRRA